MLVPTGFCMVFFAQAANQRIQMGVDAVIVLAALFVVEPGRIAASLAGALALNLTLAVNHKPGRYVAM